MAPTTSLHSCVVCGNFTNEKNVKSLTEQDDFWKQHAEEIKTGSQVPLKEFLKYFGVSLNSIVASVEAADSDQVLEDLIVCSYCNDWVLYGAFLKEKYFWADRVLRGKITNAFISDRLDSSVRSSSGAVLKKLRQCLMPCCVRVKRIVAPAQEAGHTSSLQPPLAKRFKTGASVQDRQESIRDELDIRPAAGDPTDSHESDENSGAGDTAMDYDDPFDVTEALDVTMGDRVDDLQKPDSVDEMSSKEISLRSKVHPKKVSPKSLVFKLKHGPKSKRGTQENTCIPSENLLNGQQKIFKVVVFRECPVCKVGVQDYIKHMIKKHYVQAHRLLLNNFWCRGCKIAYQPPDLETPTGQYLPQHHDAFLQFIQTHTKRACSVSKDVEPHPCRFCDFVSQARASPAIMLIEHEAKFHFDRFGEDYPLAMKVIQWSSDEAKQKRLAQKQRKQLQQFCAPDSLAKSVPGKQTAAAPKSAKSKRENVERKHTKLNPRSPSVVLNELKNEVDPGERNVQDQLMTDDSTANFEDACDNIEAAQKTTQESANEAPPETCRSLDLPQSKTLELGRDSSAVRRSSRSRKPTVKPNNQNASSSEDGEDDPDGSRCDQEPSIVDLETSESEESEQDSDERDNSAAEAHGKKASKDKERKNLKQTSSKKLLVVLDDDDEEPDDGSEKLPCVLCDTQASRPNLQNHYKVKHNLITPNESYFACRGCQHAFLSPNRNLPTGKVVPEDIENLKDFIRVHDVCKNMFDHNESGNYQPNPLHFCRYCFKKYCGKNSLNDCIKHETETHENANLEAISLPDVPSVFLHYCVYCKFKTELLDDLYKHMRTHKKQHRYGCYRCDAQFKDVQELAYHIRLHGTSSDIFEDCLLCDAYMDAPSIVCHYQQHHGLEMVNYKYFGCWHCEEAFLSVHSARASGTVLQDDMETFKQFAIRHQNCQLIRQHPAKQQKCRKCPSTFTTMRELVQHEELKHAPLDQRYVRDCCCGTCGRSFSSDEDLQNHMVLHLPEEYGFKGTVPFHDCPHCHYSFATHSKLAFDRHLLKHNPDKAAKYRSLVRMARTQFYENRNVNSNGNHITACHICGDKSGFGAVIWRHYHRSHNIGIVSNQMYCLGCKEPFVDEADGAPRQMHKPTEEAKQQLKEFVEKHKKCPEGPEKPIQCICCQKTRPKVVSFLQHFSHHQPDRGRAIPFTKLDCLRCGESFNSILQLKEHLKNISKPPPHLTFRTGGLNCLSCLKCFDTVTEFNIHFKYFHSNVDNEVEYECSVCHKVMKSATGLENFPETCANHETNCKAKAREEGSKTCEDFGWPDLSCYICQETFDSIQRYSAHINEHFGHAIDGLCPVCPAVFAEQEELKEHVKLHGLQTFKQFSPYYGCQSKHCLWVSDRPEAESGRLVAEDLCEFQEFAEIHENCTRPRATGYVCKFCGYQCPVQFALFLHEVTHTKRFQVYCEECGRGFPSQPTLREHAKHHQEKLLLACNLCPKKFRYRSSLEQHMNTHAGIKPFVCDQCGKGFSVSKRLQEHVQGVHNKPTEKTSPCTWGCNRMFATRREARVHEKQAHNRPRETRISNQHRGYGE